MAPTIASITYTPVSGGSVQIKNINKDATNSVDGFGLFNLQIDLKDGPTNGVTDITIPLHSTSAAGWSSDISVLTSTSVLNPAAAHLQPPGIGDDITGFASVSIPEPGILILLGIAMSAIGMASWRISKI